MKRKFINKVIALTTVGAVLTTLSSIKVSAAWGTDNQNNVYYTKDGSKATGWTKINGTSYYFDENGTMKTGWIQLDSSWYYLDNSGALKTGWVYYNKNWYYSDSSGIMQTGILKIVGKTYIFGSNGVMQTGNAIINGTFYTLDESGAVIGNVTPSYSKEFDQYGNSKSSNNSDRSNSSGVNSPTQSSYNQEIVDQSESNDDSNSGIKYKVTYRDDNGEVLEDDTVKKGHSIELYEPEKDGYEFVEWNTKSSGKGKSYDSGDKVKVNDDLNLYAIWKAQSSTTEVTKITLSGVSEVEVGSTIQLNADILPSTATNAKVNWSVTSEGGSATVDSDGVITGVTTGTVLVTATAADGSGITSSKQITVAAQKTLVTGLSISGDSLAITADGGTLDMSSLLTVSPDNASNKSVKWSISKVAENSGDTVGDATISDAGVLTAVSDGTIKVIATAQDGSGINTSKFVHISNQTTKLTSITVRGKNNIRTVDVSDDTHSYSLQMYADLKPTSADIVSTEWSVEDATTSGSTMTGKAAISSSGVLTGSQEGTVTVTAKVTDKSGDVITGSKEINVVQLVTGINVTQSTTSAAITTNAGTLQMEAEITPTNANTKDVTWSVVENDGKDSTTDKATISKSGILTAAKNGEVLVKATATDGSGIVGSEVVTISGQLIKISSLTVNSSSSSMKIGSTITTPVTMQMTAVTTPTVVSDSSVTWSVKEKGTYGTVDTNKATINSSGVLTAKSPGTVIVIATANDGSGVVATKQIKIVRKVEAVIVQGEDSLTKVSNKGQLQMVAAVSPSDADNQTVTWSVVQATSDEIAANSGLTSTPGIASIDSSGMLTGSATGRVKVIATSNYDSSIKGELLIDVVTPVTSIEIDPSSQVLTAGAQLQMTANVTESATQQGVTWSVKDVSGDTNMVSISSAGVLTTSSQITQKTIVTVTAKAKDGYGAYGTSTITINPAS